MADKRDISRLLKQGFTGWEAGLLVLEDSWISSRNQEGFLSDSDISNLKAGLKTDKDVRDYNKLIQLYRTADYIERQAISGILGATGSLERAAGLGYLRVAPILADEILSRQLQIMTQKQYEEERQTIMARQRQHKLQELEYLDLVLSERMIRRSPQEWQDEWSQAETDPEEGIPDLGDFLRERHPELWPQAIQDILELIQAGKLRPAQLSQEDRDKLISMEEQSQAYRERSYPPGETREELIQRAIARKQPEGWTRQDDRDWYKLIQDKEAFTLEAYQRAGQARDYQDILISQLEQLKAGTLPEAEAEVLLAYTYCLGEDLYQSGLPEWKEQIDTYHAMLYEHDLNESNVAIIPKPRPDQVDKRGYYNRRELSHWPFAPMMAEEKEWTDLHSEVTEVATSEIRQMLARKQVLRELGCYIGLALDEMTAFGIDHLLKPAIGRYNMLAETVSALPMDNHYEQLEKIRIDLDKLRPPAKELAEVRSWISETLGEQWYKGAEAGKAEPRPIMRLLEKEAEHES